MKILVTTLGKGRRDENGYREATYRFADGETSVKTPFFGLALMEYLAHQDAGLDKVVVLGTTGSIWDAWWQVAEDLLDTRADLFHRLGDMVDNVERNEDLLIELAGTLTEKFGKTFECKFIPSGTTEAEQMEILQIINGVGEKGDTVYLDVTHGFRHLPMLEMMSVFLMKANFDIGGIFYGAFENTDENGNTPAVSLTGMLHLQEWIEAMAVFRETGNVIPLARIGTMQPFREYLERYQFYSQMNNVAQARSTARSILLQLKELPPEGMLFASQLADIFSWAEDQRYARRQFRQANAAYESGDYLRMTIMLMEGVISAKAGRGNERNAEVRRQTQENLNATHEEQWHILRKLRNSFAHDGEPTGRGAATVLRMRTDKIEFDRGMHDIMEWVERQMPID